MEHGTLHVERKYELPLTDLHAGGVAGVSLEAQVIQLIAALHGVRQRARAND